MATKWSEQAAWAKPGRVGPLTGVQRASSVDVFKGRSDNWLDGHAEESTTVGTLKRALDDAKMTAVGMVYPFKATSALAGTHVPHTYYGGGKAIPYARMVMPEEVKARGGATSHAYEMLYVPAGSDTMMVTGHVDDLLLQRDIIAGITKAVVPGLVERSNYSDWAMPSAIMAAMQATEQMVSGAAVVDRSHVAGMVADRLAFLRADADEEGEPFDEASAAFLTEFCLSELVEFPAIFRVESGNLRAIWEDRPARAQIGMQFLPNGLVQFVILHYGPQGLQEAVGIEPAGVVRAIADLAGLSHLWNHGDR